MKFIFILILSIYSYATDIKTYSNYQEAIEKGQKTNKKVLLVLTTNNCYWCRKMKKETLKNQEVIKLINDNFIFVLLNNTKDKYPEKFSSNFFPTTYLIEPKKEAEITVMHGYVKADILIDDLSFLTSD